MTVPLPLLRTKLFIPRGRPGHIVRPHLLQKLTAGLSHKLTLVSAPAGFGKTSLVAGWRATPEGAHPLMGWVALDEADQDPMRFWLYVVAALEGARPGLTGEAFAMLRATPPAPLDILLPALVNALADQPDELLLVLDDYHLITADDVHAGLRYLLDHQPANLHLMLLTRADPPLPLARLRAQGELVEIRAGDLRFRESEAAALLGNIPGLELAPADMAALVARTEGWVAGLQLAGLSLQGRDDARSFIASFVSSHRYLVDYLVEEVLLRQPAPVQQFLLRTSVLERLCGPLCEAVADVDGGRAMLEMLEQRGLFTVALDPDRRWFRYHHLFADLLRTHLLQQDPDQVASLYRKACAWYRANGMTGEAVRAALAARDFAQAGELVEAAADDLWQQSQITTLRTLLDALPDTVLRVSPRLLIEKARLLLHVDADMPQAETLIATARDLLDRPTPALPGADRPTADTQILRAQLATLGAQCARALGDPHSSVEQCRWALAHLPADDPAWRPIASTVLALTYQEAGDLEAAVALLQSNPTGRNTPFMAVLQTCLLGDFQFALGRLQDAHDTYQQALRIADGQNAQVRSTGWAHTGLGAILYEWNRVAEAQTHLQSGLELGQRYGHQDTVWRATRILTFVSQMQGDATTARTALKLLDEMVITGANPMTRAASFAQHAQQHLLEGNLAEAQRSVARIGGQLANALAASWPETLAPARVALAAGRPDEAVTYLQQHLAIVTPAAEVDPQVRALALLAVALAAKGDAPGSLSALDQALALGEPYGYRRTFLDEGAPMLALLRKVEARGVRTRYIQELLHAAGAAVTSASATVAANVGTVAATTDSPAITAADTTQPLAEPLTERELEVLRLAAAGLSNAEIGARIYISPGTAKNHLHNILGKLGAANRLQAINRARELGLL